MSSSNDLMLHIAFALAAALTLPKYWTVHIDTPRAGARAEFEKTDVEFYGIQRDIYAEHHVDRPPVVVFSADGVYYGMRPRTSLSDIEKPSAVPEDVRKLISEKTAAVSDRTHALLSTHHNEIWESDTDLSTIDGAAAPKFMLMRVDDVKPAKLHDYDEILKNVRTACGKANVGIIGFYSVYGDGTNRYLFTSDSPIDLRAIAGASLMRQWNGCVTSSKETAAKARPDLSSTEPAHWLLP